jgi:dienelactone hydrolase
MSDPARIHFKDATYDGQFARTLSAALDGCADLGEAFLAARAVRTCSGSAWWDAWSAVAERATTTATAAGAADDRVTARYAWFRAAEYHRQSYFFLRSHLTDERLRRGYAGQVSAFRSALALLPYPASAVQIPYQDVHLNGYWHTPDGSGAARPTVILPAGYDSSAESMFGVPDAVERGFNVLTYEGPGQGGALYEQGLHFGPEMETVVTPVIDWLVARPDVDASRIVFIGRSFGGYIGARAAAFEHRIAALVLDPAQPRMADRIPRGFVGAIAPHVVNLQMRMSANRAEFFGSRMATHGLHTIADYFAELRRFDMMPVADRISCPTLIVDAENDFAGGSADLLRDAMTSAPVTVVPLTAAEGADGHCGGIGQRVWAAKVYPWLRATLAGDEHAIRTSSAADR